MNTFSIRDLRERTGELVRTAEEGGLSVVTKHGQPVFVAVPFDDAMLANGVAAGMAIKLYKEHVVSLGRAARIAGMSLQAFMSCLGTMGIPVVDYEPSELARELAVLEDE